MNRGNTVRTAAILVYGIFVCASFTAGFGPGKQIGFNFLSFAIELLKILPCAFLLIGLFEVWVKKETVEKHFGKECGIRGYAWCVLFAGTTVGGLYVALPVAYSLYSKGAKLGIVFTYIGSAALCRIPMILFEASFLGIRFSAIRLFVSLPLVVASSVLLGKHLEKKRFKMTDTGS